MADPNLQYDPITGWNDSSVFLTNPPNQAATRNLFQRLYTQIQTFINTTLISWIKGLDSENVKKTGDQTIDSVKTFTSSPIVPTPTTDMQTSTKKYADDKDTTRKTYIDTNFTTKDEITNNRKLSPTGDFTGTWNGTPPNTRNNFEATVDPTKTDDSTKGYAVGSEWINTVKDLFYKCVDESVGDANWESFQPITSTGDYSSNMIKFFAIPGASGKVRLKVEKPVDADSVMLRYKTSAWQAGDTETTGTLIVNIADDSNTKGANQWYEVSGLVDGTQYFFKAFPFKNIACNRAIGVNETTSKAGGLLAEYTMDSVAGTTINDTSGNSRNATSYNSVVYQSGIVGNQAKGDGISARVDIPGTGFDLANKTVTGFFKFNNVSTLNVLLTADSDTYFLNGMYSIYASSNVITVKPKGNGGASTYSDLLTNNNFYCMKHTGNVCKVRRNAEGYTSITGDTVSSSNTTNAIRLLTNRLASANFSDGSIDQLRIYNRELETYEVDNIYNGGAGC